MKKALFVCMFFCISSVSATTIDFNSASFSNVATYTDQGVTFSTPGSTFSTSTTLNGTTGLLNDDPAHREYRADITGGAGMVSVDLGKNGPWMLFEFDLYLKIFDSDDNLLDTIIKRNGTCCDIEMVPLSLTSVSPISYATFGISGVDPSSVFVDNFSYQVPIPAAAFMFAPAFLGFMGLRRRAKNKTV